MGAKRGNGNAVVHGAYSLARIERVARAQKRRFLARNGVVVGDLSAPALAYLESWSRCQAKIEAIDRYIAEKGLIRDDGTPQPVMTLYTSLQNSARLAMTKLEDALRRERRSDPHAALNAYLAEKYGDGA